MEDQEPSKVETIVKVCVLLWSATLLSLSYYEPPSGKKIVDFDPTFIASIFSASTASLGFQIKNKTPLEVTDIYRDDISGELVCKLTPDGKGEFTAALTNLKLDIKHPLYQKVKNYQAEVSEALGKLDEEDTRQTRIEQEDRGGFRVGSLYKNKKLR